MEENKNKAGRPRESDDTQYLFFKLPIQYEAIIDRYKLSDNETNTEFVKRAINFYTGVLEYQRNPLVDVSQPQMSLQDVARLLKLASALSSQES